MGALTCTVTATNDAGTSSMSTPSNTATPVPATPPGGNVEAPPQVLPGRMFIASISGCTPPRKSHSPSRARARRQPALTRER
jgi:hypothetical protein